MKRFPEKRVALLSLGLLLTPMTANAVICTDPTGNALHVKEMLESAGRWIEEKSTWLADMSQEKALAIFEAQRDEYNASAEISAITTSVSSTSNAHAEERYSVSPSACQTLTRVVAINDALGKVNCGSPYEEQLRILQLARIRDCENGSSALHCFEMRDKRNAITSRLTEAVNERDGEVLSGMLDGATALGIGGKEMTPETEQQNQDALALLIGVDDAPSLPRRMDGSMADANDPIAILQTTKWMRDRTVEAVANEALLRIHNLYAHQDGKASIMAQLDETVAYYNSEEFIKLITNTNDKSELMSGSFDTDHPEENHSRNASLPTDKQAVSSEQVIRFIAEMMTTELRISSLELETALSTNSLTALSLKEKL